MDIFNQKYDYASGSKANRMRAFWGQGSNFMVVQVLEVLVEEWLEYAGYSAERPTEEFLKILLWLKVSAPVLIEVQTPDIFLSHLYDLNQITFCGAVRMQRERLKNSEYSEEELFGIFYNQGLPMTVDKLYEVIEMI